MTAKHPARHALAGHTVQVKTGRPLCGQKNSADTPVPLLVEDWWDRVYGDTWMTVRGNPACMGYAVRVGSVGLPVDDEVIYGHTADKLGHLVHESEIQKEAA